MQTVLDMLDWFLPSLTENYQSMSPMGSLQRAQSALRELHSQQKTIETTDQLMVSNNCVYVYVEVYEVFLYLHCCFF